MKTSGKRNPKQEKVSKLKKAYRKIKQLMKYKTEQLNSISDPLVVKFKLHEIEELNHQRIFIERKLGGLV